VQNYTRNSIIIIVAIRLNIDSLLKNKKNNKLNQVIVEIRET